MTRIRSVTTGLIVFLGVSGCASEAPLPEDMERERESRAEPVEPDRSALAGTSGEASEHAGISADDNATHPPGAPVLELDGSELGAAPRDIDGRPSETVLYIDENGSVQRKVIELSRADMDFTQRIAEDFVAFTREVGGDPTSDETALWRQSWGLPSVVEARQQVRDLMTRPDEVILLDDRATVRSDGELDQLKAANDSNRLAAWGAMIDYGGGVCSTILGNDNSVVFFAQDDFYGDRICLFNAWSNEAHAVIHWTYAAYWGYGVNVRSFIQGSNDGTRRRNVGTDWGGQTGDGSDLAPHNLRLDNSDAAVAVWEAPRSSDAICFHNIPSTQP